MKKILVIDDSPLMRRVISDIINSTSEYQVEYTASDGAMGLAIIEEHKDDITAIISDINMPNMNGLELFKIVKDRRIGIPIIVFSSTDDASDTITALELGAIEFIKKPEKIFGQQRSEYIDRVLNALKIAASVRERRLSYSTYSESNASVQANIEKKLEIARNNISRIRNNGQTRTTLGSENSVPSKTVDDNKVSAVEKGADNVKRLVALCCSTGGPRALQFVIPKLPKNLAAPITIVQHMPAGFTASLASRLNDMSQINVKECCDNEEIKPGNCYIAKGGTHLTVKSERGINSIIFDDSPAVVGLKPCGNIMYNSLINSDYDEIICVVLTGMGADGTKGITELAKHKKVFVIAQDEQSSTVYGMPKAIYQKGIVDVVCTLTDVAGEITKKVGVR